MSIFSGLSLESLSSAVKLAGSSPEALGTLAVVGIVVMLAIGIVGGMIAHGVGGFYAHIQEEDELARLEEERLEKEALIKEQPGQAQPEGEQAAQVQLEEERKELNP